MKTQTKLKPTLTVAGEWLEDSDAVQVKCPHCGQKHILGMDEFEFRNAVVVWCDDDRPETRYVVLIPEWGGPGGLRRGWPGVPLLIHMGKWM